ncbi:cilia- and flagella-associated protein 45 [Asparagus officinalis]|nr:cilia- and flagella-associated protein 45 [Asparagus officinalis]
MADDSAAVLSDVDDEDASPVPVTISSSSSDEQQQRIRDLLSQLDEERRARQESDDALKRRDESINRLRAFAQDVIKKRDDAVRDKDQANSKLADSTKEKDEILKQLADAIRDKDEILKQKDSLKSEMEMAAQMMATGIDKISGKVSAFKNFAGPRAALGRRSDASRVWPAVAYGVIKRANEIVEELMKHIDGATKSRDQAREQIEQRNYEIAIEVSQLEATINGLRDEVLKNGADIERLEKLVSERDAKISDMERKVSELREFGEEKDGKLRNLEAKVDSQRLVIIDQLSNVSKVYEQIHEIVRIADGDAVDQLLDSLFVWEEVDMDENLQTLLKGTVSVYETAKIAVDKLRGRMEENRREIDGLKEKVDGLLAEKQHIGTLLRSALQSKTNEVLQVAEDGLREAGIDLRFNGHGKSGVPEGEDEVYTLAGALENTVKASQLEIIELKHLVEALRAESSLLKAHLDAQAKDIAQQMNLIKELEEKEHLANENVEGLMLDIAAAEEEIARWKAAAEQEAAAGGAVEQEFLSQLSALRQELDETKQAMSMLENKLKFKEEIAAAALAARDAAENSLKLADSRSARLRERVEELSRQIEESDNRIGPMNTQNNHRYVCWPWKWLGLNFVRHQPDVLENTNEMELSEPLI